MDEQLTIGEVSRLANIPASTLRYYESIGLLPAPRRVSGQRRYPHSILQQLAVIQLAKEANFSLPEIQALMHTPGDPRTPSERWKDLVGQKLAEVNSIIERALELKQLLEEGLTCDALQFELDVGLQEKALNSSD
jgi:MerR family transcriptional regulator, redox-sensitive transcriptional activator SoxR